MTAYRLLTAIVIAALVLPAHAGSGELRVVSSPELLVVGGNRPGDPAQRLVVRTLPSVPTLRQASVSYEQSGITRFTATVSIGSRTIDVEGTAGPETFGMHWVDLGPGAGVETSFRFGEASLDAFISQAGPDDVTLEDFARFREAVERSAGWPVVQEANLYLSSDVRINQGVFRRDLSQSIQLRFNFLFQANLGELFSWPLYYPPLTAFLPNCNTQALWMLAKR